MNLIPVDGRNMLSGQDHDNIVLGSAPPSPEPSEPAQVPTSPPLPPLPPAEQSFGGAASYAAASSARQELPPLPHVESQTQPPPRETFASSLQQLSSEAAFLPRSTLERTASTTLHGANANQNPSLRPQATAMTRTISEDAELYIPGLMSTSLFVMLPDTDSLTPIIEKYLPPQHRPPRDLTGARQGRTLEQLISSRSWRAVAEYCHDSIMAASPEQTSLLLSLWSLRLQTLLRLHLIDHLTTELSALFALLPPSSYLAPSPPPPSAEHPRFHPAVPFELHVLLASLHGLRGDLDRTVEALAAILRNAKEELWAARRRKDEAQERLWRRRAEEVGQLVAESLRQLKSPSSASTLLASSSSFPSSSLLQTLTRLHISTGDMTSVSQSIAAMSKLPSSNSPNRAARKAQALEKVAKGEWAQAEKEWWALVEDDQEDAEAQNNLAVVLLFQCKLNEAIEMLKAVLSTSAGYSETVLFNLATLHDLRRDSEHALPAKLELLRGVLERGGEGLRGTCLKLAV